MRAMYGSISLGCCALLIGCGASHVSHHQTPSALARRCGYEISSNDHDLPARLLVHPARASANERVRVLGVFSEDPEAAARSVNCEVPFIIDHFNFGSGIATAPIDGRFYWVWVRCEQMAPLQACDGKYVELLGTYDPERPGNYSGPDRIVNVTSVREIPMPPGWSQGQSQEEADASAP